MNCSKTQTNYNSIALSPVLAIPELNTKFGLSIFSNSLVNLLGDLNEARILQQLHWWLTQDYGVILKGFRWIYKSIAEWIRDALPDLTQWKARSAVLRLEAKGIIVRQKLNKEHYKTNRNAKNQTYYYRINYKRLQELIRDRLSEMGANPVDEQYPFLDNQQTTGAVNPLVSSFLADPKTSFLADLKPSFLECQKTDQNNYQNRLHIHIEGESNTKTSTEEQEKEASKDFGLEPEIKINPSSSIPDLEKDNLPSPVLQNNTKRVTTNEGRRQEAEVKSLNPPSALCPRTTPNAFGVASGGHSAPLPSAIERKYDRSLGINPPEQQKNLQQRLYDWMPDGEWCVNGKLDSNFQEWLAQTWVKNYGGNLDEAKANVLINFKKDVANIPIRWEQYRSQVLKRYDNASIRMANGVELSPEEQQELINHSRAINNPLPEKHSVVSCLQNNLLIGEIINGELLPSKEEVVEKDPLPKREVPKAKDGTFAENPEAYQIYQPEKIDNPANLGDLVARLKKATKGAECTPLATPNAFGVVRRLANKFTMPSAEAPREEKPLHIMSIAEVNELLQDPVMRIDLLPKLHKSDRFEVFCNELGEVEYVDFAF